jgi:hypothetical protein
MSGLPATAEGSVLYHYCVNLCSSTTLLQLRDALPTHLVSSTHTSACYQRVQLEESRVLHSIGRYILPSQQANTQKVSQPN